MSGLMLLTTIWFDFRFGTKFFYVRFGYLTIPSITKVAIMFLLQILTSIVHSL